MVALLGDLVYILTMKLDRTRTGITGFSRSPAGRLLEQCYDFDHELGVAYERCIAYEKEAHSHDRLNLAFPRGSSVIEFSMGSGRKKCRIDEGYFLWMPAEVEHAQRCVSTVYDNFAIFPTDGFVKDLARKMKVDPSKYLATDLAQCRYKRTHLLNELVVRYFNLRVLDCSESESNQIDSVGEQLLTEVVRIVAQSDRPKIQKVPQEESGNLGVSRAIQWIEGNLFSKIKTRDLVEHSRMSSATLFRAFRNELKMTPFEYIRERRLDEAKALLKTGRYAVGDVGVLVGYEDLSAFSKAFKLRFRRAPKMFLPSANP